MGIRKQTPLLPYFIVLMRVLFGIGWFLAGVTKITEKLWFEEPGLFLKKYLVHSLQNSNVPLFYKSFIDNIVLEHTMVLNYVIPITQMIIGIFLIVGLFTLPSILTCLFMHVNFILSGNMNLISLILYTSAFLLIIFRSKLYYISLDRYFNLDTIFKNKENKRTATISPLSNKERFFSNS